MEVPVKVMEVGPASVERRGDMRETGQDGALVRVRRVKGRGDVEGDGGVRMWPPAARPWA